MTDSSSSGPDTMLASASSAETPQPPDRGGTAREQMNIVVVGHVDHGKSTLIGRLLADTESLPEGKLEHVQAICERQGKVFEHAFLLDALEAEQDQGITIDAARVFFKTDLRDYIIIDAPGHVEFLKNMISGAARAEAAVLLIDANEGVQENSRRHGYLLSMLGIDQVTVVVNKMDLVGYDRETFQRIEREYREFLEPLGVHPEYFIPISARRGDGVAWHGDAMPWYEGPTILQTLDLFQKAPPTEDQPLRMPVQDVYKFNTRGDDRRIVAGRLESGRIRVGDRIVFQPSHKTSTVASIEAFNEDPPPQEARATRSIGITLSEQVYVERGEIVSHPDHPTHVSTRFRANLFWLGKRPMVPGQWYKLKLTTRTVRCRIHEIRRVIDAGELEGEPEQEQIGRHDIGEVVLETRRPIAFDRIHDFQSTGRFVIVDRYDVAGGGIILEPVADDYEEVRREAQARDFEWVAGHVTRADREARHGHRAALVLFTGEVGVGKRDIARELERQLFQDDRMPYLLEAGNVLRGVERDQLQGADPTAGGGLSDVDHDEMFRRYAEVAYLFVDAGHLVISTSNTFPLSDPRHLANLLGDAPVVTVHVGDAPSADTDLTVPPSTEPAEAVPRIRQLLADREVVYEAEQA